MGKVRDCEAEYADEQSRSGCVVKPYCGIRLCGSQVLRAWDVEDSDGLSITGWKVGLAADLDQESMLRIGR